MEDEWHVSDSEEEENISHVPLKISKNSKVADVFTGNDSQSSSNHYVPRSLVSLYERISNEGFITLHCQASRQNFERNENKQKNPVGQVADINADSPTQSDIGNHNDNDMKCKTSKSMEIEEVNIAKIKRKPSVLEFDYEEELFETAFTFPRKSNKSGIDKFKKTKRVGTMENVINDLNRLNELNAQIPENKK